MVCHEITPELVKSVWSGMSLRIDEHVPLGRIGSNKAFMQWNVVRIIRIKRFCSRF